jgi:hypothetical protein
MNYANPTKQEMEQMELNHLRYKILKLKLPFNVRKSAIGRGTFVVTRLKDNKDVFFGLDRLRTEAYLLGIWQGMKQD